MVKRFFGVILILVFFLSLPLSLHADVVMGNSFFDENEDKTEEIDQSFVINSPSGYVIPRDEPGSGKGISSNKAYKSNIYGQVFVPSIYGMFVFKNGELCGIEAIYLYKGKYWGVMYPDHGYQPSGWVLMDDLSVIYEREDFEKENEKNFYTYTGSFEAVLTAEKLVIWQWPGSDKEKKVIKDKEMISKCDDVLFAYKDSEGREWGKTNFTEGWICISDPENKTNIPAFYSTYKQLNWLHDGNYDWTKEARVWPSAEPTAEVITAAINGKLPVPSGLSEAENKLNMTLLIVITVSTAAVITIGLVIRKKVKRVKKDNK